LHDLDPTFNDAQRWSRLFEGSFARDASRW
jgi:hypothetical protein